MWMLTIKDPKVQMEPPDRREGEELGTEAAQKSTAWTSERAQGIKVLAEQTW